MARTFLFGTLIKCICMLHFTASEELTAKDVYEILSSRINNVYTDMEIFRKDMKNMNSRVDQINEIVMVLAGSQHENTTTVAHKSESNASDKHHTSLNIKSYVTVVQKALHSEKRYMRAMHEKIENKMQTLEDYIRIEQSEITTNLTALKQDIESSKFNISQQQQNSEEVMNKTLRKYALKQATAEKNDAKIQTALAIKEREIDALSQSQQKIGLTVKDLITDTELKKNADQRKESRLQTQLGRIEKTLDYATTKLSTLKAKIDRRKISFSSYLETALQNIPYHSKIIFGGVMNNVGHGYNSSTGIFTCPKSGVYLFAFTVAAFDFDAHFCLKVGDITTYSAFADGRAGLEHLLLSQASNVVTVHVEKDQQVFIEAEGVSTGASAYFTTFTGTLLF